MCEYIIIVYLKTVGVGLDCFLFQITHKLVTESGAKEVGHPEHAYKHTWSER